MTTQPAMTIGGRLGEVARRDPQRIAVVEREKSITFGDLDAAASAIATRILRVTGTNPRPVCLFLQNKLPAIQAIFGAGKSGSPYVLLDAGDPQQRLAFILGDCQPVALLSEACLMERTRALVPPGCALLDIGQSTDAAGWPLPDVDASSLLYLCYTSGSTGQPKGVGQTHRNLLFFADAYAKSLQVVAGDRLSLLYTLSFNAANMDIFGGLLRGATLCAYDMRAEGIPQLADWLDRERVTILHAVPTVFRELLARIPPARMLPHLRAVDLGGESVFASDVERFRRHTLPGCILVNQLASTEVGLIAQFAIDHRGPPLRGSIVPVGRCPEGVRVEIRRDDGNAAGVDEAGEMIVCSPYVSPGYWRRPDLDAAVFHVDPRQPGERHYASGDTGRIDEHGNLYFLGRRGSRVKVRGHSVDLMEIEAALAACAGVAKSAVTSREDGGESDGVRVVAHVVADAGARLDSQVLRQQLSTRLPAYMLPADVIFVDALPLTASGKVDRNALSSVAVVAAKQPRQLAPLQGDVERRVAQIFAQLLHVPAIGRDDEFFMLGGDSLMGVELQCRLRDEFAVHVGNFHDNATVARIAAGIESRLAAPAPASMPMLIPLWRQGGLTPLFLVHGRHGQAFVSPHFMRLLGNDQPVWAFQARGLDGLQAPHASVEDMAADYLVELRNVQPGGPYFLGALCAGAYVAAAMANALRDHGETVLPLLLLDPPRRLLGGGYSQMSERAFVSKMKDRRALGRSAGPADDPAYMQGVIRAARAFEQAIAAHRPKPYDGDVYMLSSRQRSGGSHADVLGQTFTGRLERFEVGSTHAEALDPRNPAFAECLLRCVGLIHDAAKTR